ncbi:hypothetical protein ABZ864_04980 [Streptomyces sp. NPDC047082]|uniref:hypothetical protein n=1 Tax=Streptomyces sp. NPDC047082 TaxID=3155259 RepID=UPI0033E6EE42
MALAHPASRTGGVSYTAVLPGGSAPADGQFADVAVLRLTAPAPAGREPARLRPCGPARGRTVRIFGRATGDPPGLWVAG